MSYVAINVLTVPEGGGSTLEERFAARQGSVDSAPGFEHFELLRPLEGTDDYLVYTRWRSEADFTAWRSSQSFGQGHGQASGRPEGARPAATGSMIWAFEVAQRSSARPSAHEDITGVVSTDPGAHQDQVVPLQDEGEPGVA